MEHANPRLLSVIVIGLNEEARLAECLNAVIVGKPRGYELEVFYVDSGSTDRSVAIAGSIPGVTVVHLNDPKPSAAKARNKGLKMVSGKYVQLVDGDSVIQSGWMYTAIKALEQSPDISCVFGHCIEMYPERSIYMKVCGLEWHRPAGDSRFCGGNSVWRTSVIAGEGYFDEGLRLGEEPDLCYRVRQRGGRIVCLDVPMVKHDLGIVHFRQYWQRGVNSGVSYMNVASRYWRRSEKLWLREVIRNFAEPLIWVVICLIGWGMGSLPVMLAMLMAWWLLRALRTGYGVRDVVANFSDAFLYGLHCQFNRIPIVVGQLTVLRNLLRSEKR